jgi:hypothetical protein
MKLRLGVGFEHAQDSITSAARRMEDENWNALIEELIKSTNLASVPNPRDQPRSSITSSSSSSPLVAK